MATYNNWTYPSAQAITGNTKISEADNKLTLGIADLEAWTNGTGDYSGVGLNDYVDSSLTEWLITFTEDQIVVEW